MNPLDHLSVRLLRLGYALGRSWRGTGTFRAACGRQWRRTGSSPLAWASLYCLILAVLGYALLDRPIAWWAKAHIAGDAEGFWKTVTHLGLGAVWLVPSGLLTAGLLLAWRAAPTLESRGRLAALAWYPGFLFAAVAGSGLLNTLVKVVVGRTRPKLLFEQGVYGFEPWTHVYVTNSFPSGHSQAAFAAMTALALMIPRYELAFLAIALLVAASRVLTSVHFLSDVVAGAWLGTMFTVLLYRALRARGVDPRLGGGRSAE